MSDNPTPKKEYRRKTPVNSPLIPYRLQNSTKIQSKFDLIYLIFRPSFYLYYVKHNLCDDWNTT